jgi:uncharacterized protein YdaU (DUF1376 family)
VADKSEYHRLPYYQYYPASFDLSTAEFTLSEVGAYQRLLNHQWANGSIPGDSIKALALILRCTPNTAKSIWKVVGVKFSRGDDGRWRNAKMERVRSDAEAFRMKQAGNGSKGGRPKKPTENPQETQALTQAATETEAKKSLLSLPSSLKEETKEPSPPPRVRGGGLLLSPLEFAKLEEKFAFVGARLRVPHVLHRELLPKLGGVEADARLKAWYGELDEAAEQSGEPIPDVFVWLRPKFKTWAMQAGNEASRERLIRELEAEYGR